jgi:hypothetical protein
MLLMLTCYVELEITLVQPGNVLALPIGTLLIPDHIGTC